MTRIPAGKMEYHSLPSFYGLTATLMTPSAFDSNKQYAASMSSNGNVCVISGVVSILPSAIKARISSQSQPKMDEVNFRASRSQKQNLFRLW